MNLGQKRKQAADAMSTACFGWALGGARFRLKDSHQATRNAHHEHDQQHAQILATVCHVGCARLTQEIPAIA